VNGRGTLRMHSPRRAAGLASWLLWILAAVVLSGIISVSIVQGRHRMWFGLVALSTVLVFASLGRRWRLRVLLVSVLVSPLLLGSSVPLPFGLRLSQAALLFVVAADVLSGFWQGHREPAPAIVGARYYVPFALFAFAGLVSTYLNGELFMFWTTVCLVPVLLLYAVERLATDETDGVWLIRAALVAILGFAAIVWVAQATGHSQLMSKYGVMWRFADARTITLGPLDFDVWSIRLGSLAALGVPAAVVLAVCAKAARERLVYLAVMVALAAVLGFTAARGALIGAAVGAVVALFVSRRLTSTRVVFGLMVLAIILAIAGPSLLQLLPQQGVARIADLGGGAGSILNFRYRVGVIDTALSGILSHPLGPGFQYLWRQFHIDEAVAYTHILNGTGLLGFCAFVAMIIQLCRGYLSGALRRSRGLPADLAAIGIGTIVAALLAGVSSQSVFTEPVQSYVLWTIVAATLTGLLRSRALARLGPAGAGGTLGEGTPSQPAEALRLPSAEASLPDV